MKSLDSKQKLPGTAVDESSPDVAGQGTPKTKGKRAKESWKRSDERLESFFTHAPAGLLIVDDELRFVRVNETAARANGLSADKHIGKTIQEVDPSLAPIIEPILRNVLATGRESLNMELSGTLPNSHERRHLLASCFPVPGIGGKRQVGAIVVDITDRKRAEQDAEKVKSQLEAQLRQAQKMEAVGRLAGGVAHDFNNLLTVINGYAKMTLSSLSNHHPGREDLEEIVLAGERAADFARQLLAFSRRQVLQPLVLDLNVVIADLNKMLRRLINEDIELVTIPGPELGRVMADPSQIEQVIMNLAVNARDAMPKGGKLVIETANEHVSDEYARKRPGMRPGEFVTLSVSDNGCGMDKETLARIFEPFFTTKEKDKGTGLGLCTIYGIVKQSEGYFGVQSEPGRGTTFKIYLPRTHQNVSDILKTGIGESKPARGAETVLLVEDEDNLRKLAWRVLERNGYRVHEADSGAAALKTWQEHQAGIDLLLTDMVMPGGLSGRQLAERLKSEKPNLKVIYSSGHNDEMIGITFPLPRDFSFLRKPYNPSKLLQTVRNSLGGR
jgi:PAS domain S-box-containing protein